MAGGYDPARIAAQHPAGQPGAERSLPGFSDTERLPWLDAEEDALDGGFSAARAWLALCAGLALLLAIAGGGWWVWHRSHSASQSADGSIIAAPPGPIKVAPDNPGGKTFEGTGDSSFAVSRGHNPGATLAAGGDGADAAPVQAPAASNGPAATPAPTAGVVGVQIGAYPSQAAAEAGWANFAKAYDALSGVSHRVVAGPADIGTVWRLQAVTGSAAAADALCARLKAAALNCEVKEP